MIEVRIINDPWADSNYPSNIAINWINVRKRWKHSPKKEIANKLLPCYQLNMSDYGKLQNFDQEKDPVPQADDGTYLIH